MCFVDSIINSGMRKREQINNNSIAMMRVGKKSGVSELDTLCANPSPKKIQDLCRQPALEGIGPTIVSGINDSRR